VGTWISNIYAIDTTSTDAKLGVASVTSNPVVNTFDKGYGTVWTTTKLMVGYMQIFKSWGNPAVVLK